MNDFPFPVHSALLVLYPGIGVLLMTIKILHIARPPFFLLLAR